MREAIAGLALGNGGQRTSGMSSIDDPDKKLDLYLRAIEYHITKLARSEQTGPASECDIQWRAGTNRAS